MTTLPIPSGPTNREIIDRAYQVLGLSDSMFGRTPEEYASAMLPLGGMMLEPPFDGLGYYEDDAAGLRAEEESGISRQWLEVVAYCLAERIGPTIGKTLSPEAVRVKSRLYARLTATFAIVPTVSYAFGTPRGAGNRRWFGGSYYGPTVTTSPLTITAVPVSTVPVTTTSPPPSPPPPPSGASMDFSLASNSQYVGAIL